jgi:predicted HicB family RNase H-like nuclease
MTTPPLRERRRVITLRVEPALKHRIHTTARQQGLSEAAAVLRAVRRVFGDDMLPPFRSPSTARDPASDRLTLRLRPGDSEALRARARARRMPDSTYVAALVRAHLTAHPPVPAQELQLLKEATGTLSALSRTLREIERQQRLGQPAGSALTSQLAMLQAECARIERALSDYARQALRSWEAPHGWT